MSKRDKLSLKNGMLDIDELVKNIDAPLAYYRRDKTRNPFINLLLTGSPTIKKEKKIMSRLSSEQSDFSAMLEKAPYLKHLWDFNERMFIPEKVEQFLNTASHGEVIMARFFLGVWQGENDFNFDLFEAVKTLDTANLEIIIDWVKAPVAP